MNTRLTIHHAKRISRQLGTNIVIISFDPGPDGTFQVASWGTTKPNCLVLGRWVDEFCKKMQDGTIPPPKGDL